jgi:hypothetical protein
MFAVKAVRGGWRCESPEKGQQGSAASGSAISIAVLAKQPRHDLNSGHSAHAPFLDC